MSAQDVADLKAWMLTDAFLLPVANKVLGILVAPNSANDQNSALLARSVIVNIDGKTSAHANYVRNTNTNANNVAIGTATWTQSVNKDLDELAAAVAKIPTGPGIGGGGGVDLTKVTGHQAEQADITFTVNA